MVAPPSINHLTRSELQEVYLLQTRLQKMPYKHIAAHLKKTELACRLHYHQLSHGSNRRKRTTSVSSGSSAGQSPVLATSMPSPLRESPPLTVASPNRAGSCDAPSPPRAQMLGMAGSSEYGSPSRLPQILPKPANMALPPPSESPAGGYPTPVTESHPASVGAPLTVHSSTLAHKPTTPSLRLDCSPLPPLASGQGHTPVNMGRLNAIYGAHRGAFWSAIASEYGGGASPTTLEQAWKMGVCCSSHNLVTPMSPLFSPKNAERDVYGKVKQDKTRIAAILGIDANPRSPQEREMVRRLEEERSGSTVCSTA